MFARYGDILQCETDLNKSLPVIIAVRAVILFAGINLSDRLSLLPEHLGTIEFIPFFNVLTVFLTIFYLILWRFLRALRAQLYFQIMADLVMTTVFVASTNEFDGAFVSFYLLIISYCSLTLGKNAGIVSAAFSAICYSGIIISMRVGIIDSSNTSTNVLMDAVTIGSRTLGFVAVAYLGTRLNFRLNVMERALDEKANSLAQLHRINDHIVSSIRSGLITTDLNGRVAIFNTAAGEMTGKKQDEVLGSSVSSIVGEIFWELILETGLSRRAATMSHEAWIRHSDGTLRFFGFIVSPLLDVRNKHLGYIISFQDLSEIVRLEKEVRHRERMAAAGRMAAVVAHEIRNPLTAIRGSVEILRSRASLPEKDERLLNILISESDRMDSFIEDFLNFAAPRPKPKTLLDIVPILRDSVTLMENSPEIKGKYSIGLDIDTSQMFVAGNTDQIRQVFWNLAQNAARAMPEGGYLKIHAAAVYGVCEVTFTDNGIGMTPEEIEQIFQPFHSGFSRGFGLGLSIVFKIMEDHNGKISCESEKGKGTKVVLSFPLKERDKDNHGDSAYS